MLHCDLKTHSVYTGASVSSERLQSGLVESCSKRELCQAAAAMETQAGALPEATNLTASGSHSADATSPTPPVPTAGLLLRVGEGLFSGLIPACARLH